MTCTIEKTGRRHYIVGNTYQIKDQLKDAGCNYDPDRKQWWTSKKEVAEKFAGTEVKAGNGGGNDGDGEKQVVAGRASYKGRTYYLAGRVERGRTRWDKDAVHEIGTRDGQKVLLVFTDGSKKFWADYSLVEVTKRYNRPQTIGGLKEFAKRAKSDEPRCCECGGFGELVADLEDGMLKHSWCCDIAP